MVTKVKGSVWDADNTYTPSGTGAVERTLQSKLDEIVSVKDFGADSSGATDSLDEFNASAVESTLPIIPGDGTYNLSATPNGRYLALDDPTFTGAGNDILYRKLRDMVLGNKYQIRLPSWGHTKEINVYRTNKGYKTDYSPYNERPTPTGSTYYVDPVNGSDAAAGTSGAPFKSLNHALGLGAGNEIILKPGHYNYYTGWQAVDPAGSIIVRCENGIARLTLDLESRVWTESATYPGLFETNTVKGSESWTALAPDLMLRDTSNIASTTAGGTYIAPLLLTQLQGGSVGYHVGATTTSVRLPNDGNPNQFLRVMHKSENVVCKANSSVQANIWLENLEVEYAFTHAMSVSTSTDDSNLWIVNCKAKGGLTGDGIRLFNNGTAVLYQCEASDNYLDGIAYHSNFSVSGSTLIDMLEIDCSGHWNGKDSVGNNNGSTIHGGRMIRLNGDFSNNQDRCIHDVGSSVVVSIGTVARQSLTGKASWSIDLGGSSGGAAGNTQAYFVECETDTLEIQGTLADVWIDANTIYDTLSNTAAPDVILYEP